jgi:hypothetical protein
MKNAAWRCNLVVRWLPVGCISLRRKPKPKTAGEVPGLLFINFALHLLRRCESLSDHGDSAHPSFGWANYKRQDLVIRTEELRFRPGQSGLQLHRVAGMAIAGLGIEGAAQNQASNVKGCCADLLRLKSIPSPQPLSPISGRGALQACLMEFAFYLAAGVAVAYIRGDYRG